MYNRALIYYLFFMVLGCSGFIMSTINPYITIFVFLVILIPFFFTLNNKKFFFINVAFLLMGMFCFKLYFNISMGSRECVRVVEKRRYKCEASFKGRRVLLRGNVKELKEGQKIYIEGEFKNKQEIERGIVGEYVVKSYKKEDQVKRDIIERMYEVKKAIYDKYCDRLGNDKASIIMALCCGEGKYISYENKQDYKKLGIVHVLCVSGFHISIVYKVLEGIVGFKLAGVLCLFYVIFTGLKPSAIRAYIMIIILKFSKNVYRSYDSLSALCLAAIILISIRPYYILDIGFNLSFLSTLGIILYSSKLRRVLYRLPEFINDSLCISLSAQVFSLPYTAFTLNTVSVGFLAANILLLPIYSVAIVIGNISLMLIPVRFLFKNICYIIYTLMTILQGGNYLLLKITPELINFNSSYALSILCIYLHCILLKKSMQYNNNLL